MRTIHTARSEPNILRQEIEQVNMFAMKQTATFTQYNEFMRNKAVEVHPTINSKDQTQYLKLLNRLKELWI